MSKNFDTSTGVGGGFGQSGGIDVSSFQDGEIAVYDDTKQELEGRNVFVDEFGLLTVGTNSIALGSAHIMSSGYENVFFENQFTDKQYYPVWQEGTINADETPFARMYTTALIVRTITPENGDDKTGTVTNPSYTSSSTNNGRVFALYVEASVTMTNCFADLVDIASGSLVYRAPLGTLTADVEKRIELVPPFDAMATVVTRLDFVSEDGDIILKADVTNVYPWLAFDSQRFEDKPIALIEDLGGGSGGYLGVFTDLTALQAAHPTANSGDHATVTSPSANIFYWDGAWLDSGTGSTGDMLKSVYDPTSINSSPFNMDNMTEGSLTKILTDTERTKLAGIESLAEVNNVSDINATDLTDAGESSLHYHDSDRDRSSHTGTQLAATILDFDTEVSSNLTVTANTAKVTNATHTGDVTGGTNLTVSSTAISGRTLITGVGGMEVLVNDAGTLKKVDLSDLIGGGDVKIYHGESLPISSTSSSSFQNKLTFNLPVGFLAGDYLVELSYGWRHSSSSSDIEVDFLLDSSSIGTRTHRQEPRDGGSDQSQAAFRRFKKTMTGGAHTLEVDFRAANGSGTSYMWDAIIVITKVDIQ